MTLREELHRAISDALGAAMAADSRRAISTEKLVDVVMEILAQRERPEEQ